MHADLLFGFCRKLLELEDFDSVLGSHTSELCANLLNALSVTDLASSNVTLFAAEMLHARPLCGRHFPQSIKPKLAEALIARLEPLSSIDPAVIAVLCVCVQATEACLKKKQLASVGRAILGLAKSSSLANVMIVYLFSMDGVVAS